MVVSHLNDNASTAVKRDAVLNEVYETSKGYHLSIEGIRKGYLFREKWYIKGQLVWTSGRSAPV